MTIATLTLHLPAGYINNELIVKLLTEYKMMPIFLSNATEYLINSARL